MRHPILLLSLACLALSAMANPSGPSSKDGQPTLLDLAKVKLTKTSRWLSTRADDKALTPERLALLHTQRLNLVRDIETLLRSAKSGKQRIELNLRLARLYMEDYYDNVEKYFLAHSNSNAAYSFGFDLSLDKAQAIYKYLIRYFPKDPRRDEMLYFYAVTSLEKKDAKKAMSTFNELATQYPKSKFASDSLAQLGDYYYDQYNYNKAIESYEGIMHKKNMSLVPYAVYKKAWCLYNLGKLDKSLEYFKWVIKSEDRITTASSLKIRDEAIRDIVFPLADLKKVGESITFFNSFPKPIYRNGLESMAMLFNERGDYDRAISLWQHLLDTDATNLDSPLDEVKIVQAMILENHTNEAFKRMFSVVPNYLTGSKWDKANELQALKKEGSVHELETYARSHAVTLDDTAIKMNTPALAQTARRWYERYLEFFASAKSALDVQVRLGELVFRQRDYAEASRLFVEVYRSALAPQKQKHDALARALASMDKQLAEENGGQPLRMISSEALRASDTSASTTVVAYNPVEKSFLDLSGEYLSKFSQAQDCPDVLYERTLLQYRHQDRTLAYAGFSKLVKGYPNHATSPSAGRLMMDIQNRDENYPKLVTTCEWLLQNGSKEVGFRKQTEDILRHAILKNIDAIEQKSDFANAADQYLKYTVDHGFQDASLHEKALYNAAVDFGRADRFLRANETLEKFLRLFPKSRLKSDALATLAGNYELLFDFKTSADYFTRFSKEYPSDSRVKESLRRAALYYRGAGEVTLAEHTYLNMMDRYPKDKNQIETDLFDLYESAGAIKKIATYERKTLAKPLSPDSFVHHSLILADVVYRMSGELPHRTMKAALKTAMENEDRMRKSPEGVEGLARLLFWSLSPKEEAFRKVGFGKPGHAANMEKTMQRKLELLKELEEEYARVSSLGSEQWGIASMYRTAAAYRRLAMEAFEAPIPSTLKGAAVDQYREETKKLLVVPFNEKAAGLVSRCLEQAVELHILSPWAAKCYALGTDIDSKSFPAARTVYLPAEQVAATAPQEGSLPIGKRTSLASAEFSTLLYDRSLPSRVVANARTAFPAWIETSGLNESNSSPIAVNYSIASQERKHNLEEASAKIQKRGDKTFSELNVLRLSAPDDAIRAVKEAITHFPHDAALSNLLALAYLEKKNLSTAEVIWRSMLLRGQDTPAVWNNLGVVAQMRGRWSEAITDFTKASQNEGIAVADRNLGFMALACREGKEAKSYFEHALVKEPGEATAEAGLFSAEVQNREVVSIPSRATSLAKKFPKDPYARLAAAYAVIDGTDDRPLAEKLLSEYLEGRANDESSFLFYRALKDAKGIRGDMASIE